MGTIKDEAKGYEPKAKVVCIECGKKLNCNKSIRCRRCYNELFKEYSPFAKGFKAEKNGMWKGKNVSYSGIHKWIRRWKPKKDFCEHCGKKLKLDIANISGEYKREFDDYFWLCKKCHSKFDNQLNHRRYKNERRTTK